MFNSFKKTIKRFHILLFSIVCILLIAISVFFAQGMRMLSTESKKSAAENENLTTLLNTTSKELQQLKQEDQYVVNQKLAKEMDDIKKTYKQSAETYEKLLTIKEKTNKTENLDALYAQVIKYLADKNYSSASATLTKLNTEITKKQTEITTSFSIPQSVKEVNTPPGSGYARQAVKSDVGTFMVDIISADLNSTKVIVDTASDGDCGNDCPVMALGEYAARSGAFAGINGPYFCPASYPACADKKNSFDTLIMNKNKTYFNSANNVYSTVPAAIFAGNSARFVGQSLEWGRDTGVDAVIASQPLLLMNEEVRFGGDAEAKRSSKGSRSFIGASDSMVYIGVVHNATTAEVAQVLKAMGVKHALNLDSGGSTALWSSGRYIVGPGRNTPFGILLVRK